MPSSPPEPPPANANTGPANALTTTTDSTAVSALGIVLLVGSILIGFLWHLGAASLSYAKYGSIGWAILDFFFASLYYPFYALVLNTPTAAVLGGGRSRRRMKFF